MDTGKKLIIALIVLFSFTTFAFAGEIHDAVQKGDLVKVRMLLEKNPELVNAKDEYGRTTLHWASLRIHFEIIKLLVSKGAEVNIKDNLKITPLFFAIRGGHLETIKLLIEKGADPNIKNTIADMTPLYMTAYLGLHKESELLIASGADLNVKNNYGETPLHGATKEGNTEGHEGVIRLLIENGANKNARDLGGNTPLHFAVTNGRKNLVEILIDKGAEINSKNNYGKTSLHQAVIGGYLNIANYLLIHGAEINSEDENGKTPLYYAAKHGHKNVFELLSSKGGKADDMEKNFSISPLLKKDLKEKEAIIWYLGHSGWAIKTKNHFLIFDYWEYMEKPANPLLANGHINPSEIKDQDVFVFTSHKHRDHYDKVIVEWKKSIEKITYIFGLEIKEDLKYEYFGPRKKAKIGDIVILIINSEKAGIEEAAFLVKVDGFVIYHAGDYSNYFIDDEIYRSDIDYMATLAKEFDMLFIPTAGGETGGKFTTGALYTIEKTQPQAMFPMHCGGTEYLYKAFAKEAAKKNFKTKIICAENRGDRFFYHNEQIK